MMIAVDISSKQREEMIDITSIIEEKLELSKLADGICFVFVPHTTAAICINESYDSSVKHDILSFLSKAVPKKALYRHLEGNSDAHIKASIIGSSVAIFFKGRKLLLGRWQGIFFCEFDGPRDRKAYIYFGN